MAQWLLWITPVAHKIAYAGSHHERMARVQATLRRWRVGRRRSAVSIPGRPRGPESPAAALLRLAGVPRRRSRPTRGTGIFPALPRGDGHELRPRYRRGRTVGPGLSGPSPR